MDRNLLKEYIGEFEGETSKNPIQLEDKYYQQIPNVLLNDVCNGVLKAMDIAVYMAFKSHLGSNGYTWPSNQRICKLTHISKKTLQKSVKRLEDAKHIQRVPNPDGGTWKTYLLTVPDGGTVTRKQPIALVPLPKLPVPEFAPVIIEPAGHEITAEPVPNSQLYYRYADATAKEVDSSEENVSTPEEILAEWEEESGDEKDII